nr:hypothetical protein CFP56_52567 [Quercus suber]
MVVVNHLERRHVDAILLVTTTHGKVLIQLVEAVLAVAIGDGAEQLDVVEDLVIVGEVVAGDNVDPGVLLDLPVLEAKSLALGEELVAGELAAPVRLGGLLQVTKTTHTREAQDGGLNHDGGVCEEGGIRGVGWRWVVWIPWKAGSVVSEEDVEGA